MSLLDLASLVLAPTATKEGKVYSAIPDTGDGDMTFSRGSAATRVNSAGLIEKERTNLALYSEQFDNAAWTKTNTSVTANSVTSPDGTQNADTITSTAALPNILSPLAAFASTTNVSIFVKYVSQQWVQLMSGGAVNAYANFDIQNGVIGTVGSNASNAQIENLGNGWYRISVNLLGFTGNTNLYFGFVASGTAGWNTFDPNFNKSLYAWGAQIETGDIATEYIPTTSSAVSVGITDDVPRVDYSGGGCPALLLEPQRTNLALYSEQFDNAAWTKTDATINANAVVSPDGYQNADTIIENATSNRHRIYRAISKSTVATTYTFSIYIKNYSGSRNIRINLESSIGGSRATVVFDTSGNIVTSPSVVGTFTNPSASAKLQGGYWRYSLTATSDIGNLIIPIFLLNDGTTDVYLGDGTSGVYIWGAQLEAGSYATSYIPTYSVSSTRVADSCYKTGISELIGQTEGTLFFDANFDDSDTVNFSISDGTSSNYVLIDTTSARSVFARVQQGGVTQVQINTTSSFYSVGERLKCAIAYKSNDFAFYINGTSIGTDNSGSVPALDQLRFSRWNGALAATQRINQAILFPTRLTNNQLEELTK